MSSAIKRVIWDASGQCGGLAFDDHLKGTGNILLLIS